jgi:hypothetical protein
MLGPPSDERRARLIEAITRGDRAREILLLVEQLEHAMTEFDEALSKPPIAALLERKCVKCGTLFTPEPRAGRRAKYCGDRCRKEVAQAARRSHAMPGAPRPRPRSG